jgi:hypothetical protein
VNRPTKNRGIRAADGDIIAREENDSSHAENIDFNLISPCENHLTHNKMSGEINFLMPCSHQNRRKIARLDSSEPSNSSNQPAQVENKKNCDDKARGEVNVQKSIFLPRYQNIPLKESDENCNNDNQIHPLEEIKFLVDSSKLDIISYSPSYTQKLTQFIFNSEKQINPKLPRLILKKETFIKSNQNSGLEELLETIENYTLDGNSKGIPTQSHLQSNIIIAALGNFLGGGNIDEKMVENKYTIFRAKEDIWYTYWKDQTRVNLKHFCQDNVQSKFLKELFSTYMFMVILILSIIPQEKPSLGVPESLTYAQDLATASALFKDLANGLRKPDELGSHEWERIKNHIPSNKVLRAGVRTRKAIVWVFLETWVKIYCKGVWSLFNKKNGINLSKNFKTVMHRLFAYSQESLTKYYKELIIQKGLQL